MIRDPTPEISLLAWPSASLRTVRLQAEKFFQMCVNRFAVGNRRYGPPTATQRYLTRLEKELAVYKANGNREQLLNIANYALLEFFYPESTNSHFDPHAKSVTRSKSKKKNREWWNSYP